MWRVFADSASTSAMVIILVGCGMLFSRVLLRVGVAEAAAALIMGISENPIIILLSINILLLILGMFMESICIMVIIVPLLLPLFDTIGLNLVHAGAICVLNLGIGMVTPPFAATLFVGSRVSRVPLLTLAKPTLVFVLLGAIPTLLLTTYIPGLSLWLPVILCGPRIVGVGP